jgi:hypothetical protein
MRLIYPIVVLFLLASLSAGQLAPDRERFDIVLHPGEVEEKALTLTNSGDTPIFKIDSTPVSGNAKDLIFMHMPEIDMLPPGEKIEGSVFFAIPPETRPGSYTGFIYLLDSTPPSMPIKIEFYIDVVEPDSYGLSMTIDDAKSASTFAKADEPATFDLSIRNLGRFRDVASIDVSSLPEGWTVSLLDGEDEYPLPYELPLNPGINHPMVLQVQPSVPGDEGELIMTATSLGNKSKNDTVKASAEFGLEIRAYNVKVDLPERMVANRTYSGDFNIALDVDEDVQVGIITPMELMVIPLTQVIEVTPERPGRANFTMLASHTGEYPIIFKLMDSNGMPMPDELATVKVVEPEGVAILTGDEFLYKTVASLCRPENRSVPVVTLSAGRLSEKDREGLQSYAKVVILGNESIVSTNAERSLDVTEVKRLKGDSLCEVTLRFISEMWQNGTAEAVLSGTKQTDIFRAYQEARLRNLPLIVCDSPMNNVTRSLAEDLTKRNTSLLKVLAVGEISPETAKELKGLNISIEEVAQ